EFLIGALMFHAYGAYAVLLREEFGGSKTILSAAFAMSRAESGILGPVQGWLTDRFGPRALIRLGMTIFGVGFLLFSRIDGPGPRDMACGRMAISPSRCVGSTRGISPRARRCAPARSGSFLSATAEHCSSCRR